ncbi:hypothetical protein M758_UG274000 [Ceratodon purpureus]|nr:hypothetical protein M758_UG274000 [Ceratodon purpureus]
MVLLQSTKMMDEFMRLAKSNTTRNLETCGVLAGSLVRTTCRFASHLYCRCSLKKFLIGLISVFVMSLIAFNKEVVEPLNIFVLLYFAEKGYLLCVYSHRTKVGSHVRFLSSS